MSEDEFGQLSIGKSPVLIHQCMCTKIPKDFQNSPSKNKIFLSLKEWLFPPKNQIQPATQNLTNSKS